MIESKWKQKIENGSEKLLFSKLDAFVEKFGFSCIVWWRITASNVINSSFLEFVSLFQNSNGIIFLINKSNAEYYHNTIFVMNCNNTLSVYNMCLHLFVVIPLSFKRYVRLKINYIMKSFQKLNKTCITLLEN